MNSTPPFPAARKPRPFLLALRYGSAVAGVATGFGLWAVFTAWLGPGLPTFITFYPFVIVVALLAGVGPGLLATALTLVVAARWIMPPIGHFYIASPVDRLALVLFGGMGTAISVVAGFYRRNRDKAAAYERELAFRESQARLATFAQATFEGIIESEAGRIVDCNEQFARMAGRSVAELKGMEIASLIAPEDRDRVMASVVQGRESEIEHAMLRTDGTQIVVEAHGRPLSPGSARRHTAVRDITARKRAEEAVSRSRKTFFELVERSPFGTYVVDSQFRIAQMNTASQEGAFRNVRPVIGRDFSEAMHILWPEPVAAEIIGHFRHTLDTGEPYYSPRFTEPRHDVVIVESYEWELHRMTLPDAQHGVICYYYDSTKLREAEAALRESEERFRILTNMAPDAVFVNRLDGRFVEVNVQACQSLGYTREQLMDLSASDIEANLDAGAVRDVLDSMTPGSSRALETRHRRRDGSCFPVEVRLACLELRGERMFLAQVRDATERKQAEEDLRRSREDLDRAQAVGQIGSWRLDVRRDVLTWSDENHRIFGLPKGTPMSYETFLSTIHPDDRQYVDTQWQAGVRGAPYDIEHRIVVDGQVKWVREKAYLEFDTAGQLLGGFGITQDITERRRAEEVLRQSAAELHESSKAALNLMDDAVRAREEAELLNAQLRGEVRERTRAESELRRLNRTLRALSQSSLAITRAQTEQGLLDEVCGLIVDECGHAMAWVGFAENDDARSVRPVAHAGSEEGYLETLQLTWADRERGRGPTGTAIRTGRVCVCPNMLTDAHFVPWREQARRRGYASSIALPLISGGQAFGALTIYSGQTDPFSADEVKLLGELADDLAHGLKTLRLRESRQQAETALRRSNARLDLLAETASALLHSDEPQSVVDALCRKVLAFLDCQVFVNFLVVESAEVGGRKAEDGGQKTGDSGPTADDGVAQTSQSAVSQVFQPATAANGSTPVPPAHLANSKACDTAGTNAGATEKAERRLRLNAFAGISDEVARRIQWLDFGVAVCGCAARDGCRIVAEDIPHTDDPRTELVKSFGVQAYACHPLIVGGRVLGTLSFGTRTRARFTEEELSLMKVVADQAAIAMERQRAAASLREAVEDLARSNRDLEQFAYVASHDLQEPLRAVAGYTQLLQDQYPDRLDARGRQFIAGAAEGAARMQTLIHDLLAFARVSTKGKPFEVADLNTALDQALANLAVSLREASAVVTRASLPSLPVDATQITQLFQNLIGNAVKYRSDRPLRIDIAARRQADGWCLAVQDNGIGIEPRYFERIFQIFQRLHTRAEYPGTGIGLAICKKIVERHGGAIWIESQPGQGSTFTFTLLNNPSR